jgi:hypothetical protein
LDGAPQNGSECHIENISAFTQEPPGLMRLRDALVGETDIGPASFIVWVSSFENIICS